MFCFIFLFSTGARKSVSAFWQSPVESVRKQVRRILFVFAGGQQVEDRQQSCKVLRIWKAFYENCYPCRAFVKYPAIRRMPCIWTRHLRLFSNRRPVYEKTSDTRAVGRDGNAFLSRCVSVRLSFLGCSSLDAVHTSSAFAVNLCITVCCFAAGKR